MRLAPWKILPLLACLLAISSFGWAQVINFINLPTNGTPIPNGYAELDWINFYRMSTNVLLTPMKAAQLSGAVLPSTTFASTTAEHPQPLLPLTCSTSPAHG